MTSPGVAGPAVQFDIAEGGRVAVLTLNRPERLNAYDIRMRDALWEALGAVRDDPQIRAVILRGNGRAFCSGGDLHEFGTAPSPVRARDVRMLRDVWGLLWNLPAITIAAVHGLAVGSGFEMALLCDQCLASRDARFALPETGLGMLPGVGGTQTLPRLVGSARAQDLVFTGAWLDASTAQRWGLVARLTTPAGLLPAAHAMARRIARRDPDLLRRLKRAVRDGLDQPLPQGLALERVLATRGPEDPSAAVASPVPRAGRRVARRRRSE